MPTRPITWASVRSGTGAAAVAVAAELMGRLCDAVALLKCDGTTQIGENRPMARPHRPTPVGDTDPFRPSRGRPVRVRSRDLPADSHFDPHRHAWAQLAYCASGVLQVSAVRPTG